jgi:thiamine biosynthesis protein ThiS
MRLILDGAEKSIDHKGTISSLLKKLNIRSEEVAIKVNGQIAPETTKINADDKIEIIRVIFGG